MGIQFKTEKLKYLACSGILTIGIAVLVGRTWMPWFDKPRNIFPEIQHASIISPLQLHLPVLSQSVVTEVEVQPSQDDGLWDGPILFHESNSEPIYLILIEKDVQELTVYRYDGQYHKEKTYRCVTGKQWGDKQVENDDRTPEGIYFNNKTYRDNKVTIFGDRAFGLNYPDVFDDLDGNGGSGIFLHGSNRDITPYSTNGCLVMNNEDIADLDKHVPLIATPVIIGNRLPYRFAPSHRNLTKVVPFIKRAMLPKVHAKKDVTYSRFTMISYQDQVVALGIVEIDAPSNIQGVSRVYLAYPDNDLYVLLKREWNEEKKRITQSKTSESTEAKKESAQIETLVESWRIAWQDKMLDAYISHYHPQFLNNDKDLIEWKRHKQNLNNIYNKISVTLLNLTVKIDKNKAFAFFKQHYKSESYEASGYKKLEFRKTDDSWKIYREQFYKSKPKNWPI